MTAAIEGVWWLPDQPEQSPGSGALLVLFDDSRYGVLRPLVDDPPLDAPADVATARAEPAEEALRAMATQSGTYSVAGSTLELRCLRAEDPAIVGSTSSWTLYLDDDRLRLRPVSAVHVPGRDLMFERARPPG